MTSVTALLTADEFDQLPEPETGGKMELVDGEVVVEMTVNEEHGELQLAIGGALREFVRRHGLGRVSVETGYRLQDTPGQPQTVRAPDVSFRSTANAVDPGSRRGCSLPTVPDLAVEITSPSTRDAVISRKVADYLAAGVPIVWVVRPELRTVTVHRPGGLARTYGRGETLTSAEAGFPVEGFSLSLDDLFDLG